MQATTFRLLRAAGWTVRWLFLVVVLGFACANGWGEEMVTIPRSRLVELERKEAELDALRLQRGQSQHPVAAAAAPPPSATVAAVPATTNSPGGIEVKPPMASQPPTPPLGSLPPLGRNEVVSAKVLWNHYQSDPAAARARYESHPIRVTGEIAGFEKPLFVRPFFVLLETDDRVGRVAARIEPPAIYSAVFTVAEGEELVGSTSSGARATLARRGQTAVLEGRCRGLDGNRIRLTGASLISVH